MIDQMCFSDVVLDATREILETMVFLGLEKNEDKDMPIKGRSLLGMITFTGDLEGCFAIDCDTKCAAVIAKNMLAMEPDDEISNEDISDAIGEVANMSMGSIKTRIHDQFPDIQISIPTVVFGTDLENTTAEHPNKVLLNTLIDGTYPARLSFLYRQSN